MKKAKKMPAELTPQEKALVSARTMSKVFMAMPAGWTSELPFGESRMDAQVESSKGYRAEIALIVKKTKHRKKAKAK